MKLSDLESQLNIAENEMRYYEKDTDSDGNFYNGEPLAYKQARERKYGIQRQIRALKEGGWDIQPRYPMASLSPQPQLISQRPLIQPTPPPYHDPEYIEFQKWKKENDPEYAKFKQEKARKAAEADRRMREEEARKQKEQEQKTIAEAKELLKKARQQAQNKTLAMLLWLLINGVSTSEKKVKTNE